MTSIRLAVTPEERASYEAHPYFGVSLLKFSVLSLCSLGIYDLFWLYQQWKRERDRTGDSLSPFWRTIFTPIWAFSLLERIHGRAMNNRVVAPWSANALALGFLILTVAWRLPDPLWLVSFLAFVPLLPVQRTINRLNAEAAPHADHNRRFSAANIALVLFGGAFAVLTVLLTFVPVE
jgi:hypothetical protein